MTTDKTFVFLDIETGGLNPSGAPILELGYIITDERFVPLDERSFLIDSSNVWSKMLSNREVPGIVEQMHQASGLSTDLEDEDRSKHGLDDVYDIFRDDLITWRRFGSDVHLAGLSVGFDREFLSAQSGVWYDAFHDGVFHHRILDLSSVKVLFELAGMPKLYQGQVAHRALADCQEALEYAHWARDTLQDMSNPFEKRGA